MRTRTRHRLAITIGSILLAARAAGATLPAASADTKVSGAIPSGRHLFERETFGGNGRTCVTCHLRGSGTLSPADARRLFARNPGSPLFLADGSDDGRGNGVERILADATILVEVPLAPNVRLVSDPTARTVTLRRGIPTVKNTAALDPVLMQDGREPDLASQALGAIRGHAAATRLPEPEELEGIADFQRQLFTSPAVRSLTRGRTSLPLPQGRNPSERRGRRFFEDRLDPADPKVGQCALCHSGPLLNETNQFFITVPPFVPGGRFQSVLVSELNTAGNPVLDFEFTNPDGTITRVQSPDPGRALITGDASDVFQSRNAFKISILRGVRHTAPYFHDNSAKTLEDVAHHYTRFFEIVTATLPPAARIKLTAQDEADLVAYMKLL